MPTGPIADQTSRPEHYEGLIDVEGQKYNFGTGGMGGHSSIPYGVYPVTPDTIGPWGRAHGAIGLNNNRIWDSKHQRMTAGIELHGWPYKPIYSEGCVAIEQGQWPAFRAQVLNMIKTHGSAYLHIWPNDAGVTPSENEPVAIPNTPVVTPIDSLFSIFGRVLRRLLSGA